MQNKALETFCLLFQGILLFQALIFVVLYFVTKRKDILYYSLFLFFSAAYFFINAPYTFFGIPEDNVWNSDWYEDVNIPTIILGNLFYLLFLKAFFADIVTDRKVNRLFRVVLWFIPVLMILFVVFTAFRVHSDLVYYIVQSVSVIPAAVIAYIIVKKRVRFAMLVVNGLICTIIGTSLTVLMNVLRNNGVHHLFTEGYPLFFVRVGILGDMIFFLAAILRKWHFQEKELAVEKLEAQLATEKLRNRISGELHDEFGSTLSGITMYSYMIGDLLQSGQYEKAKQSAGIIQRSADKMTHNLDDLVWAINPGQDSLQKLLERLEEYATDMAAAKGMKIQIEMPKEINHLHLPVDCRRNIYLFCKEAINNSVKYSGASLLELIIKRTGDWLEFRITDNGKGFNMSHVKKGNGLDNMKKRCDDIGAKFVFQSKENAGTSVSLQCKIT